MHRELIDLENALNAGEIQLAKRYVSKLKVKLFCVRCKGKIRYEQISVEQYFKGYVHSDCEDKKREEILAALEESESPFPKPKMMTGYPLSAEERENVDRVVSEAEDR